MQTNTTEYPANLQAEAAAQADASFHAHINSFI